MPRFAILFLVMEVYYFFTTYRNKPKITFLLIFLMALIHLNKSFIGKYSDPSISCVSYTLALAMEQYHRLWTHAVVHLSDTHLYYNMVSLLWQGSDLESKLGAAHFACLVGLSTVLSGLTYCGLCYGMYIVTGSGYKGLMWLVECSAGFSGVLFCMRVVGISFYRHDDAFSILGFRVPFRVPRHLIIWIELLIIHFLEPHSSFIGHLSGIVVGLLYTMGPLHFLISLFFPLNIAIRPNWNWIPGISWLRSCRSAYMRRSWREDIQWQEEPCQYSRSNPRESIQEAEWRQELIRMRVLDATERRMQRRNYVPTSFS